MDLVDAGSKKNKYVVVWYSYLLIVWYLHTIGIVTLSVTYMVQTLSRPPFVLSQRQDEGILIELKGGETKRIIGR